MKLFETESGSAAWSFNEETGERKQFVIARRIE